MNDATPMDRRLRISGLLVALGLVTELSTLHWSHPTAFLVFLIGGGLLMSFGILYYLYSLVSTKQSASGNE